jgi:hypothetical protein
MEQLFGGNAHFRLRQKVNQKHPSTQEMRTFRNLSSPALESKVFALYDPPSNSATAQETPGDHQGSGQSSRIELGPIGQEYEQNLRRTVRSQAKAMCREKTRMMSWKEEDLQSISIYEHLKQQRIQSLKHTVDHKNAVETISLLQRVALRRNEHLDDRRRIIELQASRLPMLEKKSKSKRERGLEEYSSQLNQERNGAALRRTKRKF